MRTPLPALITALVVVAVAAAAQLARTISERRQQRLDAALEANAEALVRTLAWLEGTFLPAVGDITAGTFTQSPTPQLQLAWVRGQGEHMARRVAARVAVRVAA